MLAYFDVIRAGSTNPPTTLEGGWRALVRVVGGLNVHVQHGGTRSSMDVPPWRMVDFRDLGGRGRWGGSMGALIFVWWILSRKFSKSVSVVVSSRMVSSASMLSCDARSVARSRKV